MGEVKKVKKGKVNEDIKSYHTDKNTQELLSKSLNDLKNQFKAVDMGEQLILSADESFEEYKKEYEKSIDFNIPEIEPIGMTVITSAMISNVMDFGKFLVGEDFNIDLVKQFKETVSDTQVVLAVGPNCRQVKVGDKVSLRIADFTRIKNPNSVHSQEVTELPIEEINGERYLSVHENNFRFIVKDEGYYERRK